MEMGGDFRDGGHPHSGKLKVTGMMYFRSHWMKNHVIHRTYCERRV